MQGHDREPASGTGRSWRGRLGWLLVALASGSCAGVAVRWALDSDAGFLALPALLALGWLFWADPTRCAPRGDRETR